MAPIASSARKRNDLHSVVSASPVVMTAAAVAAAVPTTVTAAAATTTAPTGDGGRSGQARRPAAVPVVARVITSNPAVAGCAAASAATVGIAVPAPLTAGASCAIRPLPPDASFAFPSTNLRPPTGTLFPADALRSELERVAVDPAFVGQLQRCGAVFNDLRLRMRHSGSYTLPCLPVLGAGVGFAAACGIIIVGVCVCVCVGRW
jgi:hypothetical protein